MSEKIEWHRKYVGSQTNEHWGLQGIIIPRLLISRGLKRYHKVCDAGCGSLRHGAPLISFLDHGNYFGVEPAKEIVETAIDKELRGNPKGARFDYNPDFNLEVFYEKFDFIFSMNVFIHCSVIQLKRFLASAQKTMNSNGKIIFNVNISSVCGSTERKPKQLYQYADHVGCYYNETCITTMFSNFGFFYRDIRRSPHRNNEGVTYELTLRNRSKLFL